jgi:hypothetical protein
MRFGLIDVLFTQACLGIGVGLACLLVLPLPGSVRGVGVLLGGPCIGLCLYLALIYPFYTRLRLYPMVLPRCPCCGNWPGGHRRGTIGEEQRDRDGFYVRGEWPRITFLCANCEGEFIVWQNGKPSDQEPWEKPVLALKWPYALGRYKRAKAPESGAPAKTGSADAEPALASECSALRTHQSVGILVRVVGDRFLGLTTNERASV